MNLITSIEVRGFRSIEDAVLDNMASLTTLVGRNNSGKSNLLRALSLFFSNEPEPGRALDFSMDHHTIPKRKKRKEIIVEVGFDLSEFTLKKELASQIATGLGTRFALRKKWYLSRQLQPLLELKSRKEGETEWSDVNEDLVRSFIALVNFRYIPNRTIPTETLATRRSDVTRAISKRVARTDTQAAQGLLVKIKDAAKAALLEVDRDVSASTEGISQIEAGISESIADLISLSSFRARTALGTLVSDDAWGSDTQAMLMFSVLHAVDRDRSGLFGWRQATVWAVEEPESSLHHDLAVSLAKRFHDWSSAKQDRLQIVCTTHSEIFTMGADQGYEVTLSQGKTRVKAKPIPLLAGEAARSGVTSWPQPLLAFPFNPLVFVEGGIDSRVLAHASKITGIAANCVFLSPNQLDPAVPDGADNLTSYLQKFGRLWEKRPPESPVIVLFDWDRNQSQSVDRAKHVFGDQAELRVCVMDASKANPSMTDQWAGIERFYTPEFIELAQSNGVVSCARDQDGNWLIRRNELRKAKGPLADLLCASAKPRDFGSLRTILQGIEASVAALTAGYYQTALPLTAGTA